MTTKLRLHCPCGVLDVSILYQMDRQNRPRSDPTRKVTFANVASFATSINIDVVLPIEFRWPELAEEGKRSEWTSATM